MLAGVQAPRRGAGHRLVTPRCPALSSTRAGTTGPTVKRVSRRTDFCRSLFIEMTEAFRSAPSPEGVHLPDLRISTLSRAEAVGVMFGWTNRVVRAGEATLALLDAGFESESAPLTRSMIEHAIALHWIVDTPAEAFQALVRERQRQVDMLQGAQASGWELSEETHRLIEETLRIQTDEASISVDHLLHTKHRAIKYGLGSLYQAWLVETWDSHPSLASATPYYGGDETGEISLYFEPSRESREPAATVLLATHVAFVAYDEALPGNPLARRLRQWDSRLADFLESAQES
jgi:hypothetical protein